MVADVQVLPKMDWAYTFCLHPCLRMVRGSHQLENKNLRWLLDFHFSERRVFGPAATDIAVDSLFGKGVLEKLCQIPVPRGHIHLDTQDGIEINILIVPFPVATFTELRRSRADRENDVDNVLVSATKDEC